MSMRRLANSGTPHETVDSPEPNWFVVMAVGVRKMTLQQLDDAFQIGIINARTLVSPEGADGWATLGELAELPDETLPSDRVPETAIVPRAPATAGVRRGSYATRASGGDAPGFQRCSETVFESEARGARRVWNNISGLAMALAAKADGVSRQLRDGLGQSTRSGRYALAAASVLFLASLVYAVKDSRRAASGVVAQPVTFDVPAPGPSDNLLRGRAPSAAPAPPPLAAAPPLGVGLTPAELPLETALRKAPHHRARAASVGRLRRAKKTQRR